MKNASPGLEDRLFAAEITGRKAGEADAIEKGLFVHPEENIQILRKESKGHAGCILVLPPPHYTGEVPSLG